MRKTMTLVAGGAALALTLTACGGGAEDEGAPDAAACEPSEGAVELDFTSWIPGIEEAAELWNAENPDIQVRVQTGPNGNSGTYQNFFNQLEAGNAPDIGQIEYDALPNFVAQGGLENLAACEDVVAAESEFIDWTWGQVTLGDEDAVFGIPQDSGPMALFYRADLFEEHGIEVPTTWEEYAQAAEEVRAAGGYITNFSQVDINQFAGLVWQAGGDWFSNSEEGWSVHLTGDESEQVAAYWQDLLERDLVATYPAWTPEWDEAFNRSEVWSWPSAVWGANTIASGAPDTAGKWAVAPAPQWSEGDTASGNWGGSSIAVFEGTEHLYEATQFILWLNTSEEALTLLNESANIYPATTAGLELPILGEGVEFFGGQPIYDVFAEAAQTVDPDFVWGPLMTETYTAVSDGFRRAADGQGTLQEALADGESATVDALEAQAIPVAD
ncbi:extracellular solute-binding protein [Georgenia phoenicis]|uniref:ABC transporter substrate-binding protein n=1 Tax=unclassified Georgenia TaxID=2626815 RepID=UPI0039B02149